MRARKPKSVCPASETYPWEWTEFIKVTGGWIPVSLYEMSDGLWGPKVRWWMKTSWVKTYSKDAVMILKRGTLFVKVLDIK
jgi:hypothetical protein